MSLLTLLQSGGIVVSGNGVVYYKTFWEQDMQFLRQSTASQEVLLGPFVSDTDFKTAQTGLTIANTDIKIWKNGAITEVNKNSGGATHVASGRYYAVLDATDTDTVGMLELNISISGALPVKSKYYILTQSVYDSLFATSSTGPLKPTVDGRTLDVTATGAAGIDWGNIENQNATVGFGDTSVNMVSIVENTDTLNQIMPNGISSVAFQAGSITASAIAANALDNKGNWNVGKSGYALTPTTGLGNQTANITGSIQSVTNRVTANTDQWNGVAVTGMPMPTFTLPANFSALIISSGGYVTVNGDSFGNTLIIPNLASQSSVDTLTSYVDTEVAAIKAKTDLITNFPANFSSLSISSLGAIGEVLELGPNAISANALGDDIAAAVYNAMPSAGWTNGSFGDRLLIGDTAQRNVAVTGAHHVAADIHELQPAVIDNTHFAAGAIDANALAADAASEIAVRVADEPLAGHTTAGTLGKVLSDAGSGVSTLLSRITSSVATMFGDLIAMIQGSGVLPKWTASALSLGPTGSVTATVAVPQILAHTAYNTDEIIVYRGTFWSFQITNLGDLTNLDKIWFTLRKRQNDSDSKSIIQIEKTAGLLISNGATATNPSHGTLTVSGSTITITVNQQVTQYCEVTNNLNYDIKALTTGGQVRMLTISDQFIVENDVTRRIS